MVASTLIWSTLIPLRDAANELLLELEKVAEFMDKEVIKDENANWLKSISDQKDNLIDLNGTLSGLVMNDLENNDLSFRDLGNKMSNLHQEEMTSKKSNLEKLFISANNIIRVKNCLNKSTERSWRFSNLALPILPMTAM